MTIRIKLSEFMMNSLKRQADSLEITPNVLARIQLCQINRWPQSEADPKSYIVKIENWREVEAYINVKHPGSTVGDFAAKTAISEMRRCPVKSAQKAEFDRLLGKQG